ncbi:hypothetical protein [Oscillatoria sp. HE19RPO]|uniref:hypothetical protein n=1 Tax=Oscillatoria sp. HE19RPO TaxID=2954806 RepID=UPI0020C4D6B2|nr:hypothetical protein [Oscillatoria sp. HE19RPO]
MNNKGFYSKNRTLRELAWRDRKRSDLPSAKISSYLIGFSSTVIHPIQKYLGYGQDLRNL